MTALATLGFAALLQAAAAVAVAPPVPTPIGAGPMYHPGASNASVAHGLAVGSLVCRPGNAPRSGVHLEVFGRGHVVIVPAGIGVAPPIRRRDPSVASGRCSYPVRTLEPTGVIEITRAARITLGDFFATWGRRLSSQRLLGFRAPAGDRIRAYVNGRRWAGDPRSIPLRRHDELVLEAGAYVPPHVSYRFPRGL